MNDSDGIKPYPRAESISSLIKAKVEGDGTLHLDHIQTELLLRYLAKAEMTLEGYERTIADLRKLIAGVMERGAK